MNTVLRYQQREIQESQGCYCFTSVVFLWSHFWFLWLWAASADSFWMYSDSNLWGRKQSQQTSFCVSVVSGIASCLPYIQLPSRQNKAHKLEEKAKQGYGFCLFACFIFFSLLSSSESITVLLSMWLQTVHCVAKLCIIVLRWWRLPGACSM